MFFLTEIKPDLKKMHNLQNSQVTSNRDDDTRAPEINQQGGMKPKFYILRRSVLCHFAHDKQTNA